MQVYYRLTFIVFFLISTNSFAKKIIAITSPDAKIKFWLSTDKDGLYYKVAYKGVLMVDKSRLNLTFKEGGIFNNNLVITSANPERLTEDYELITGKTSKVHSECNRIIIPVNEQAGPKRSLEIEIRVFNEVRLSGILFPNKANGPKW